MASIAVMCTYPGRLSGIAAAAESIASQVDRLIVVANQLKKSEVQAVLPARAEVFIPPSDLKDTGKFYFSFKPDDEVVLCDDDIVYPADYVAVLREAWNRHSDVRAVVGVHGVIYSDFFDGDATARIVHVFCRPLSRRQFVNQLGTGTVFCRGFQLPSYDFMASSARFVDLRFAVHCERSNYPRVCIERPDNWLREINSSVSLFSTFTQTWPAEVIAEAQEIAGFRFLPPGSLASAPKQEALLAVRPQH